MFLRLPIALLLGSGLAHTSYAQPGMSSAAACVSPAKGTNSDSPQCNLDYLSRQVTSDVVVSGASLNDGYGVGATVCGTDGQVYRPPMDRLASVMRVSRDGSTLVFALPAEAWPDVFAPDGTGLNILGHYNSRAEGDIFEMYRFDSQANLVAKHRLVVNFRPSKMAITTSGKTIVMGHPLDDAQQESAKYRGAVLDVDDHVSRSFELPPPPGGGEWKIASRMFPGETGAYAILGSDAGPQDAIAKISDAGQVEIRSVAVPPESDKHHHNEWLYGPGVAVEVYHYLVPVGATPRAFFGFNEYDLNTGEKIATKGLFPAGFAFGCYMRSEVSMLAHSAHVDPARHLSPQTIRLVTAKLQ